MNIRSILPTRAAMSAGRPQPFDDLQREIDRVFDSFTRGWPALDVLRSGQGRFVPDIEVEDSDKTIRIAAELPGVDEKDIDVSVTDNVLTIAGEKRAESERKEGGVYRTERCYGSFSRSMALPFEVNDNAVQAKFDKGVLTVTIDKPEDIGGKTKKIAVAAG